MDYSPLIIGLLGAVGTVIAAISTAYFTKRFARTAVAAGQTVEQIEAAAVKAEAKVEADRLVSEAITEAAAVKAEAKAEADRTMAERQRWHDEQVTDLRAEITDLRARLEGKQ